MEHLKVSAPVTSTLQTNIIESGSFTKDPRTGHPLGPRQVLCRISTGDVDRMNRKVNQGGITVGAYMNNPVVLWNHNASLPPIGRTVVVTHVNGVTNALLEYAPQGASPLADQLCALDMAGFLPAQSIGWLPLTTPVVDSKTGLIEFGKVELLEWSKVSIPANEHAVNASYSNAHLIEQAREFGLLTYEPLIKDFVSQGILTPRPRICTSLSVAEVADLIINNAAK